MRLSLNTNLEAELLGECVPKRELGNEDFIPFRIFYFEFVLNFQKPPERLNNRCSQNSRWHRAACSIVNRSSIVRRADSAN